MQWDSALSGVEGYQREEPGKRGRGREGGKDRGREGKREGEREGGIEARPQFEGHMGVLLRCGGDREAPSAGGRRTCHSENHWVDYQGFNNEMSAELTVVQIK